MIYPKRREKVVPALKCQKIKVELLVVVCRAVIPTTIFLVCVLFAVFDVSDDEEMSEERKGGSSQSKKTIFSLGLAPSCVLFLSTLGKRLKKKNQMLATLAARPSGTRAWQTMSFRLVPHSWHSATSGLSPQSPPPLRDGPPATFS